MDEREWPCAMHGEFTDYCHQCKRVAAYAVSEVAEATAKLRRYLEMNYSSCRADDVQQWAIGALQQEDIQAGRYSAQVGKLESALAQQRDRVRELTEALAESRKWIEERTAHLSAPQGIRNRK